MVGQATVLAHKKVGEWAGDCPRSPIGSAANGYDNHMFTTHTYLMLDACLI